MALSSVDRLRGRPVEVVFAGLRSDTYTMQNAGWRIAMEAGHHCDLIERARTMQAPEQAEIRARNASRERIHGRIHAHIMSLAA